MEFKVTTDLSVIQPQSIESNFKETKEWLQQALAPYQGMVVTEDAIAEAKTKRAEINKVKDALEDKRKAVKKQWLEPYMRKTYANLEHKGIQKSERLLSGS